MKSSALYCARGQIILCKVLLSGFILEISFTYKISFISSLFDHLYQGRWVWVSFYEKFLKGLLHFWKYQIFSSGSCANRCPPCTLGTEMSFSTLWNTKVVPCTHGASCGSAVWLQGRMLQKITRGEMIPARGRQLLQIALEIRADRLSWSLSSSGRKHAQGGIMCSHGC